MGWSKTAMLTFNGSVLPGSQEQQGSHSVDCCRGIQVLRNSSVENKDISRTFFGKTFQTNFNILKHLSLKQLPVLLHIFRTHGPFTFSSSDSQYHLLSTPHSFAPGFTPAHTVVTKLSERSAGNALTPPAFSSYSVSSQSACWSTGLRN